MEISGSRSRNSARKPFNANDPRATLKPGLNNAGQAIRNMELIATRPKPAGFTGGDTPAGSAIPPERDPAAAASANAAGGNTAGGTAAPAPPRQGPPPFDPKAANQASFVNSDLAFTGRHMFVGNYHGFNIYDVEEPRSPQLVASIVCPGGQGDVSVYRNLLFMSVEQVRGRVDCGTQGVMTAVSNERFRGVRIFDISNLKKPRQVAAIQTCRGSHTHTLVPDPKDPNTIYVYGSGTSSVRPGEELAGCSAGAMVLAGRQFAFRGGKLPFPLRWDAGLGVVSGVAVIPHYDAIDTLLNQPWAKNWGFHWQLGWVHSERIWIDK